MEQLRYLIGRNESISRWWITDRGQAAFESPRETFEGEVNLGEAYVQIVYPVRREFLKQNDLEAVSYYEGPYKRIYFPFENNRVDFTTFIHTPHHFWVNAQTFVYVEEPGTYPFEIYTCGGVKVWVNCTEAACFAPYTRNIPGKCAVQLELQAGMNEISVYADELAERDVFFYYELRYKGERTLTGVLYTEQNVRQIAETEAFLKSCYFAEDCVRSGALILKYDGALLAGELKLVIEGDPETAKLNNVEMEEVLQLTATRESNEVSLGSVLRFNVGVFKIRVGSRVGEFIISRELVVGIIPDELTDLTPLPTVQERKRQALQFISQYGESVVNRTLAILEVEHRMTDEAYAYLQNSLEMIRGKEDCADFYLVPVFLLITRYREYLPDELYAEIKGLILDFRYWIDEPGNDVMWYFSENHAFLFHISQYLSGALFPDAQFTVSERLGSEQYALGKQRVADWFATFFKYGYAEWNSATYIPIDLIGFFVLYEMAPDASIKELARQALDFTFKVVTFNTFGGIMSSSYGRAYEDTLKAREQVEPSFLEWVSYGTGYVNFRSRAVSLYCLSSYVPPAYDVEAAVQAGEWMSVELDQGYNRVKTYSFKTRDYFTACVRGFRPFEHGHQQHLMNVALGKSSVQYYINHPGERPFSGGNRPSYWAGNGTMPFIEQYRNVMVLLFNIDPEELVHHIHAYSTLYAYDEYELTEHWLFARVDEAYVGSYFSSGIELTEQGANTGKEVISPGRKHGIIVKCGSRVEFGSFDNFKSVLKQMDIAYDGEQRISFHDPQYGEITTAGTGGLTVQGQLAEREYKPEMEVLKGRL